MPKRLDRDQEPKKEGRKSNMLDKSRKRWKMNRTKMKDKNKGGSEDDSQDKERQNGHKHREMV